MASPNSEILFFSQSMEILAEILAEFSAEMLNYLLDQHNERSSLNFFTYVFCCEIKKRQKIDKSAKFGAKIAEIG